MRVKYNIDTAILFQIGDPLDQSCAAYLHNAMYEYANINAVSLDVHVKQGELGAFVEAAKSLRIKGFDITMPHKTEIIKYLDECDPLSRAFKSVNHVNIVDGKLIGVGLDGKGMAIAIEENTDTLEGKSVLIIGAGSVAGAIAAELCALGANKVMIVNRTRSKSEYIEKTLHQFFDVQVEVGDWEAAAFNEFAAQADVVVQCTSLGMEGSGTDLPFMDFVNYIPKGSICADVLYPATPFLKAAQARGIQTVDGTMMLYAQQLATMEFHFGVKLSKDIFKEAEEAVAIAVAMRTLRNKRVAEMNQK